MELAAKLLAAAAALLLAFLARSAARFYRLYVAISKLPGPPATFPLGNVPMIHSDKTSLYDTLMQLSKDYHPVARLWMLHLPVVFLFDPDDIEAVYGSQKFINKASVFYKAAEAGMGPGLLFHRDKLWKSRRKIVSSSIPQAVLQSFVTTFQKRASDLAARLEEVADEGSACRLGLLCGYASNMTVIETMVSSDNGEVTDEDRRAYLRAISGIQGMAMRRFRKPWLLVDWLYALTEEGAEYERMRSGNERFVERVIRRKRAAIAEQQQQMQDDSLPTARKRQSFVDTLLASEEGGSLTDRDVIAETMFMITAASGSTMDALTFLLYTLAIRQDMQERLHKELDDVFGGDPLRPVEASDLPHLQFTDRFIKETLRMFTVLPVNARDIHEAVTLPSGHTLPAGCTAAVFLSALHQDERLFPEPRRFDPDRFLPERSRGRHPYSYMPFSAGPRDCVASRYAAMFLKTQLATLVRRVQLLPCGGGAPRDVCDVPVTMGWAVTVRGGARVRARRRPPKATAETLPPP